MMSTYERLGVSVYATPREVIRAARRRLTKRYLRQRKNKGARWAFYKIMLRHHSEARDLVKRFRL